MDEPLMFDDYTELMDVSLTSEYDHIESLDEDVLNDIVQIILETLIKRKRKPTKQGQFDKDFSVFTATLTVEDWAKIDECIESMNSQLIQHETSDVKKKRKEFSLEQIIVLENEFSKCQSPDSYKSNEIAKTLKLSSRRVNSWFKKRRDAQENANQSSAGSSIKLTLRLIKQSGDVNAWSIFQRDTQDCFLSVSKSLTLCNSKEFTLPSSVSHCPKQFDLQNNNEFQNTEFQDDILTAKRLITGRRSKLNPHQKKTLEEEFSVSQFISAKKRRELSESLGITENQVKNWFQYRRQRLREQANKNGNDVSTTSSRKRNRAGGVSSTSKERDFDTLSVRSTASSFAWNLENSQPYNSDFGLTADNDTFLSKRCKSEYTTLWEDNELYNMFSSDENYSLLSSLGLENVCPNIGMI